MVALEGFILDPMRRPEVKKVSISRDSETHSINRRSSAGCLNDGRWRFPDDGRDL